MHKMLGCTFKVEPKLMRPEAFIEDLLPYCSNFIKSTHNVSLKSRLRYCKCNSTQYLNLSDKSNNQSRISKRVKKGILRKIKSPIRKEVLYNQRQKITLAYLDLKWVPTISAGFIVARWTHQTIQTHRIDGDNSLFIVTCEAHLNQEVKEVAT